MKYLLSLICCFIFPSVQAQNYVDLVNFSYTNTPSNDFEVSDADTTVEELALELSFPIMLNEKTILLVGAFGNKTKVDLDANMPSTSLNVLGLNLGINHTFNDTWSATFMVFPKIASDKIKFSNNNLQLGFLSLFTKKKREHLKFRYGMYANNEKYGMIVVPVFGLYYLSPNQKFEANLNLPIIADINYKINKKAWLGMKFDGLGTTYNLNEQNYSPNGAYVSKTSNELVSYLRFQIIRSIYLNAKVGYAISRNYEVYDANDKIDWSLSSIYFGDDRTQLNERFKDGAIFKIELLYRLHIN